MATKRKATGSQNDISLSTPKHPRVVRKIATKEPRKRALPDIANKKHTATTATASLLQTRPWLTRPQQISEQDVFILHCRDNLISGATGPKDWHVVTEEFNVRFKDEVKKPLAHNTLSKRCGVARKTFLKNNPEYIGLCIYPVPHVQVEMEDEPEDVEMAESEEDVDEANAEEPTPQVLTNPENPNMQEESSTRVGKVQVATQSAGVPLTPLPFSPPARPEAAFTPDIATPIPGSFNPSAIQENYIPPITRAKFHLQHRTDERVSFHLSDPHEQSRSKEDPQYIDTNTLISISPPYARAAAEDPRNTVINVPHYLSIQTVNIFIQLVSPERANKLPTHFLWKAKKPLAGVYGRYGAIQVEKITWSVDTLLDLLLFAQWMEVFWVVDMVVDRLHYMSTEQAKYRDICAEMGMPVGGYIDLGGRQVFIGSKLPPVDNLLAGVAAEDFSKDFIVALAKMSTGTPIWRFLADMLYTLGEKVEDTEWWTALSEQVQQIFSHPEDRFLDAATPREVFCARYHHHASNSEICYTSHRVHSATHFIDVLYASSSPAEQVSRSNGLAPENSLTSIMYSGTGDVGKLKRDNSTRTMLEAEKMALDMESRLYEARNALRRAREAGEGEKKNATDEASKVARSVYSHGTFAK